MIVVVVVVVVRLRQNRSFHRAGFAPVDVSLQCQALRPKDRIVEVNGVYLGGNGGLSSDQSTLVILLGDCIYYPSCIGIVAIHIRIPMSRGFQGCAFLG